MVNGDGWMTEESDGIGLDVIYEGLHTHLCTKQ